MKTNIVLPDNLFDDAQVVAEKLGITVGELYEKAILDFLRKHCKSPTSEQMLASLNEVYDSEESSLDPVLETMQLLALPQEDW
ncbi:MAG: hypothetical protein AAFQ63_19015 [Cyanobacteria bacterium J06621_11]